MLEQFISAPAAERLRSGVFGAHIDTFCAQLVELRYRPPSIVHRLWTVGAFARWMEDRRHTIAGFDEACITAFVDARRSAGRSVRSVPRTGRMLLDHLRAAGGVPQPTTDCDDPQGPVPELLAQYGVYLRRERAVTEGTISAYVSIAHALLTEHLPDACARVEALDAGNVRDFLLARAHRVPPKRLQYMGSALRSFLRFLFARGKIKKDLALAVPSLHRNRSSTVPRHMSHEDVERLLRSCDRSSATGRRNHAVLLLLARLGLRASEIVTLELGDLRWREGEIIVRGKGLVRDRLPLLADVGQAIALYLKKDRPEGASRRVFLCRRAPYRGFAHASTVSTIVGRALGAAGLAPATRGAHLLRHSLATAMVQRGASLAEIGQVLRHRSPNTTEIYAKLDFGALRDIALSWPTQGGDQ